MNTLVGKTILIVKGSLLSTSEVEAVLKERGARVRTACNSISAYTLLDREKFDGAILDKGLHNAAFDLCAELRDLDVPHILSDKPHELQKPGAKKRAAWQVVEDLILTIGIAKDDTVESRCVMSPAECGTSTRPSHERWLSSH